MLREICLQVKHMLVLPTVIIILCKVASFLFNLILFFSFQVLSALDILQPPHLDFFQEMYPFTNEKKKLSL